MTKVVEKYHCDIGGKENSSKLKGTIHRENGCLYINIYIHEEVCTECYEGIINLIQEKNE
jgi:hypothetical protein